MTSWVSGVPGDAYALRFEGTHLQAAKQFEDAAEVFRKMFEAYPFSFASRDWERALLNLHREDEAREVAGWYARINHTSPNIKAEAAVEYAKALDSVDRYMDAKALLEKEYADNPDASLLDEMGALAVAHRHYDEAVGTADHPGPARTSATQHPNERYYAHHLIEALKEIDAHQAAAEYERDTARFTDFDEDWFNLGTSIYEKLNQPQEQVENERREVAAFPHFGWPEFRLALALEGVGQYAEAAQAFARGYDHSVGSEWWLGPYQRVIAKTEGSSAVSRCIAALNARYPFEYKSNEVPDELHPAEPRHGAHRTSELTLVLQSPHHRRVTSVALSPDQSIAASADESGTVKLWDRASGLVLRTLQAHTRSINQLIFTPDGKLLITAGDDAALRAWDPKTMELVWEHTGLEHPVTAIAARTDIVVAALSDAELRSFHLLEVRADTGKAVQAINWYVGQGQNSANGFVERVWISADASRAATLNPTEGLQVWELASTRLVANVPAAKEKVALSPDFGRVAYRSGQKIVVMGGARFADQIASYDPQEMVPPLGAGSAKKDKNAPSDNDTDDVEAPSKPIVELTDVAFDADSRLLLSMIDYTARTLSIWHGAAKSALFSVPLEHANLAASSATPDLRRVLLAFDYGRYSKLVLFAVNGKSAQVERSFDVVQSSIVNSVAFTPDGAHIVLSRGESFDGNTDVWDLDKGKPSVTLAGVGPVTAVSRDGRMIADCNGIQVGKGQLWSMATGKTIRNFSSQCGSMLSPVAFTADGSSIVWEADTSIYMASLESGAASRDWNVGGPSASIVVTPDGKTIFAAVGTQIVKIDTSAEQPEVFYFGPGNVRSLAIDDSGKYLVAGIGAAIVHEISAPSADFGVRAWDLASGQPVALKDGPADSLRAGINAVAFRPGTTVIAAGQDDESAVLWDIATGEKKGEFTGHQSSVSTVSFSTDGRHLITGSDDGSAIVWDLDHGRQIATLVAFGTQDWAVTTPEGLFDGSAAGLEYLHYAVGLEPVALNQLKAEYWDPGLLADMLHYKDLSNARPLRTIALYPEVQYSAPPHGSRSLQIHLRNRGGGIGPLQVLVNRKEVVGDARTPELKANPNVPEATITVDLSGATFVPGAENDVTVIARNSDGNVASREFECTIEDDRPPDASPPKVFAIVVGISRYSDPDQSLNLNFAAKDASDFANALTLAAASLNETIAIRLLSTAATSTNDQPTKENIRAAFEALSRPGHVRPQDVLVVFLAGHGVALHAEKDLYAFLTKDAVKVNLDDYDLKNRAVTHDELVGWLTAIPATKQVMVLDTCGAAALQRALLARGQTAQQVRSIDELNRRAGIHVIMGSAAEASSYEASGLQQGLLTYALLEGFKGRAANQQKEIQVADLFRFAQNEVEGLAKRHAKVQEPEVFSARGQSFPLALLTPELAAIKIERERLTLAIAQIISRDASYDNMKITAAVRQKIEELSSVMSRGNAFRADLVENDDVPGVIIVTGAYTVVNGTVSATIKFVRDDREIGSAEVNGTASDTRTLVDDIAQEISKVVATVRD
jgi:WD40 repeat protein